MKFAFAVALLGAACGDPDDPMLVDALVDPDGAIDAAPDAPPGCELPALAAPWLATQLHDDLVTLSIPRATTTGRNAARIAIQDRLGVIGWMPQTHAYAGGANIYTVIPATVPSLQHVVVGAHFDTVSGSPGANDNASGSAVVLALARYLRDAPCRDANVILAWFDQEELGLFGSRAFAQKLVSDGTLVRAVHTVDQVAWDLDGDRVIELEQPTQALAMAYAAAATVVGNGVSTTVVPTGGTDHVPFREAGFAAIGITEEYVGGDTSPHRHLASDTAASVAPYETYLQLTAQLVARVVMVDLQ